MKKARSFDSVPSGRWGRPRRAAPLLAAAAVVYLLVIALRAGDLFGPPAAATVRHPAVAAGGEVLHRELEEPEQRERPAPERTLAAGGGGGFGRITGDMMRRHSDSEGLRWSQRGNFSELERLAGDAWALGAKAWEEAASYDGELSSVVPGGGETKCPAAVSLGGGSGGGETVAFLPCGLAVGSAVTVVGTARAAHAEYVPGLARDEAGNGTVLVSQFAVELRGLRAADGEDPPKILHLNPRLRGDWSKRPVVEMNTCFRMQWGKSMRCDGAASDDGEETVDGFKKCDKWEQSDTHDSKELKTTSWLNRFIGRAKKPEMKWPFPFAEGKMFVLTIQAGVEGYHINVAGRHVASFPYRMGFSLEDATGLAIKGDVDIHSVYATSLPQAHPSFSLQQVLEMSEKWKARPLLEEPIQLFIGILSATNHFAERMAIRKTWMQYPAIQLGNAVARFFVALSPRKEVNAALRREAEYFGDIVIVPFMDRYELVVLKTVAICQYGVRNVTAEYVMKCDDDTFVRVDVVLQHIYGMNRNISLYLGNLNLLHRPLRDGKWAVTHEEWPEEVYPPYANGPGYIISSDIAEDIVSHRANNSLRLFKMEDVSMGMWVEDFNSTSPVQYMHSWRFCQYGCMENYVTAHYQSPRQMICLWDNLSRGRAQCCNFR